MIRISIPQQKQRQDSLRDQLKDLHIMAARLGMYDAADWLWKQGELGKETEEATCPQA